MSDEASTPSNPPPDSSIDARDSKGLIFGNSGTVNQQFVINQPFSREEIQNCKNLSVMRQAVRKFWVEGVLNQSLYREALIQLNLTKRADAVDNRLWNLMMQQPGAANPLLPPGMRILEVFDQIRQRLLILGEPGSGKTTSWAERRLSLAEWLVDELRTRYSIPKHYLLRLALWLKGYIPFDLVRFLDYAAALIFLRKVGGGYIFVHRLIMEHFAGLSDNDMQRIVSPIPSR